MHLPIRRALTKRSVLLPFLVSCAAAPALVARPPVPTSASVPSPAPAPAAGLAQAAPERPPVAPVREVTDTYFGTKVVDPYRWMEDPKSTELAPWMKAQSDFTRAQLDALPSRAALFKRVTELDHAGDLAGGVARLAGRTFYWERREGHEQWRLVVRDARNGAPRVLLDPEPMATGAKHFAIDYVSVSPDGTRLAYGLSESGSESSVLHVLDVVSGETLTDSIDRAQFANPSWLDATHFTYTRQQRVAPDAPQTEKYKRSTSYLHELGRDPDKDPALLGVGVASGVPVAETDIPRVSTVFGSSWVFAIPFDGVRREMAIWYAPKRAFAGAKTLWKKLVDRSDEVVAYDVHGDDFFAVTHKGAPRSRITKMDLAHPGPSVTVVPESDVIIQDVNAARDALYVPVLDAGIGRLRRLAYGAGAKLESIALPVEGTLEAVSTTVREDGATLALESWTVPHRVYAYDPKSKSVDDMALVGPSPIDFSGVTAEEVSARSFDGTKVPLSIVHAKGIARDGARPTWLEGYGAYGITLDPSFTPAHLALFERGGVFAVCHVRGGGELGEAWHKGGMLLTKQHTIDDFIACAEWLVQNKYTSPAKLAGEGTSAGGITVGGAITQRPDLFAAALIRVGVSNPLRLEETVNVLNVPELGSVKTEDGFKGLYAMDAYTHVKAGERYPAVMLTTGVNDPRVAPWQVTKMAARLQAATSSGKPVLLRVDYDAGHGVGSTTAQRDAELADELAFLLWQLGEK